MANGTAPAAPLTSAVLAILLSLAEGEKSGSPSIVPRRGRWGGKPGSPATGPGRWGGKHGYLIMKDARTPQGGGVHLGPGTLYGSLDRMMRDGLVEESGISDDERRRYYRLTKLGHKVLAIELNRLDATVASARSLGLIPHGGRS